MNGFPIVPWLALVAVYLVSGRTRGSSWTALAGTAAGVLAAVFLEFTLAFTIGLAGLAMTMAVAAVALVAVAIARRRSSSAVLSRQPGEAGQRKWVVTP